MKPCQTCGQPYDGDGLPACRCADDSRDPVALLGLVADIRAAVGDKAGRLMQDELIERCRLLRDRFAENVALRKSLTELIALYDDFKSDDISHENAYHSFYKGQYDKWENARNLLANVTDQGRASEAPPRNQEKHDGN